LHPQPSYQKIWSTMNSSLSHQSNVSKVESSEKNY
jgi:hypothetical protein